MQVKITGLGVQLLYPFGIKGPAHELRRYIVEAEDGRIDTLEEWDEQQMPDGTYNFSEETVNSIFDKVVECDEDEW